jgi:PKD repeat protein
MMKTMVFPGRMPAVVIVLLATVWAAGCGLDDGSAPGLIGPSEFGLSVTLSASPDRVPRDGSSQSLVTITVRDASGKPEAGRQVTVSSDIGLVTPSEVMTGSNGQATVAYTAPVAGTIGNAATISAVPAGDNGDNAVPRTVTVLFLGASNRSAPAPDFTVTPTPLEVNEQGVFDASPTTDEGAPCMDACTYNWSFGDGSTATGRRVTHTYTVARNYTVTLAVTDAAGTTTSLVRTLSVSSVPAPTVTITAVPATPFVDRQTVFTASATAAPGHSIQRYEWNFGDDTTEVTTGPSVVKVFDEVGTFVVTVRATDDIGQVGIGATTVVVGFSAAAPVANFTISPTTPEEGQTVTFNGGSSTVGVGATIATFVWDFGDGSPAEDTGTTPTASHAYATAGTYGVTLTVTDSLGRVSSKTSTVTVEEP